jgi:hypothetical protein
MHSAFYGAILTAETLKEFHMKPISNTQPLWQRITLLFVLGYEAAGAVAGGLMLVIYPDGRLMQMPVSIMHGTFPDFFLPGIILFALGVLNAFAFVAVLRRRRNDWIMAGLANGGMFVWFVVEIIVLRDLHWLHAMWGLPVLLGGMCTFPLIGIRHDNGRAETAA